MQRGAHALGERMRVAQVPSAHSDYPPTGRFEPLTSINVVVERALVNSMYLAFVLDRNLLENVREVGSADEVAVSIDYFVADYRLRETRPNNDQPGSRFAGGIGP